MLAAHILHDAPRQLIRSVRVGLGIVFQLGSLERERHVDAEPVHKALGAQCEIEGLVAAAEKLPAPAGLLHVDAPDMLLPGRMMQRMNAQLVASGYKALAKIEAHTGPRLKRVFIVGGGVSFPISALAHLI